MTQPCGDSSCSSVDCRPYRLLFGLGPKKNTSPFQGIHLRNQQPLQHLQCVSICTSIANRKKEASCTRTYLLHLPSRTVEIVAQLQQRVRVIKMGIQAFMLYTYMYRCICVLYL